MIKFRNSCPVVDIKVWGLAYTDAIVEKFGCSKEKAEEALQFAFETEQEMFYRYWCTGDLVGKFFPGREVSAEQVGRSGGWLEVEGLPEDDEKLWGKGLQKAWYKFEKHVRNDIDCRTSLPNLSKLIEINGWATR